MSDEVKKDEKPVNLVKDSSSPKETNALEGYKMLQYNGMSGEITDSVTGRKWNPGVAQLATLDEITRLKKIEAGNWSTTEIGA